MQLLLGVIGHILHVCLTFIGHVYKFMPETLQKKYIFPEQNELNDLKTIISMFKNVFYCGRLLETFCIDTAIRLSYNLDAALSAMKCFS